VKREAVEYLQQSHDMSLRQACKMVQLNRSSYYYKAILTDDSEVIDVLIKKYLLILSKKVSTLFLPSLVFTK
jgi:ACT domain-containing protein